MTRREYSKRAQAARRRDHVQFIKRSILTFMAITITVFAMTFCNSMRAGAQDAVCQRSDRQLYRYYKEVHVADGDTLESIASSNMDKEHYESTGSLVREIIVANQLTSDEINSDMTLMIPYYDSSLK